MEDKYFHGYRVTYEGNFYNSKGKLLKFKKRITKNNRIDLRIRLVIKGNQKQFTASRLLVELFIGPVNGYDVDHIDDNPLNNHVSNLQRLTSSENQLKKWRRIKSAGTDSKILIFKMIVLALFLKGNK